MWRAASQAVFFITIVTGNLIGEFAVVDKSTENAARALVNVSRSWSRFEKPEKYIFLTLISKVV